MPATPAWQLSLEALDLADARVLWTDAAVKPAASLQLDGLSLSAKQAALAARRSPIPVAIKGALHTQAAGAPALAEFSAEGPVTDHDAKLGVKLTSVSLGAVRAVPGADAGAQRRRPARRAGPARLVGRGRRAAPAAGDRPASRSTT